MSTSRRQLIRSTVALVGATALGLPQWREALAATAVGSGPYGALGEPDANGVRLPDGFRARLLAVSGQPVAGSSYRWHFQPDGGATFALPGGEWAYASNAELNGTAGGVGVIRFDAAGQILGAYPILAGTK